MQLTSIRRLHSLDRGLVREHFERLDVDSLRSRFGTPVKPRFVRAYAAQILDRPGHVYGAFVGTSLRGVGELRPIDGHANGAHEAAFTVEKAFQNHHIGAALVSRLKLVAQNRGIHELHLWCERENGPMVHLAIKHGATVIGADTQVDAVLDTPHATPFSVIEEVGAEVQAYAPWLRPLPLAIPHRIAGVAARTMSSKLALAS